MSDHPDLEKLDPSVREIVREVFRDPANGTPDDISKAGCLELAAKGYKAWNAWREQFPVIHKEGYIFNNTNFEGCELQNLNFDNFIFDNFSNFEFASFSKKGTTFFNTKFGKKTSFSNVTFFDVVFSNTEFREEVCFEKVQFLGAAGFFEASFFSVSFNQSIFNKIICFNNSKFNGTTSFIKCSFMQDASFQIGNSSRLSFSNAAFKGELELLNWKFDAETSFNHSKFSLAPKFHGCSFHQDLSFDFSKFPVATGNLGAARAYRTLKVAFSQQQATKEEQRFFRLEMAEEAAMTKGFQSSLYKAYKLTSDYGFSLLRPLGLLGAALAIAAAIYGAISWQANCTLADCEFSTAWIEFSVLQALPLPGLDKISDNLRSKIFPNTGWISIAVTLTVILHKAISLLALFLVGLGLRNLFKLK